jgi:S-layer homology domain
MRFLSLGFKMKFCTSIGTGLLASFLTAMSGAAPLFPHVPENHWAKDAVAALAARGLVEGYPDGTFKGDRAASRWETAMVVARLLAKMEQAHAVFATKAELDELRKLVTALREELDALGVRTEHLRQEVGRIDSRVTELERISFYGFAETRVTMQSFSNKGAYDNDANRFGAGAPGSVEYLNYNALVGTRTSAPYRPQEQGILPTVDYLAGRALSNGTGFTSLAVLGLDIKVSEEIDAGVEFAAYSSQGDAIVDGYWGVSAPYLSNPVTAISASAQSLDNTPYTRMTLDRFWVTHRPTNTRLMVGNIDNTTMDSFVYHGQGNLGVYGPRTFPGYGFQILGRWELDQVKEQYLSYEVLGTRFGNGERDGSLDIDYQNYTLSGNVAFQHKAGKVQLNMSRVAEEAPSGGPLVVGLIDNINVAYGASGGWSAYQWVNPPGFFAAQLPAFQQANTGSIGNTVDTRPISGWSGTVDNAIGVSPGAGNYGPQAQMTYGISAFHDFQLGETNTLTLRGEYGFSDYRPNHNSPYNAEGDMFLVGLDVGLLANNLDLGVDYLSVAPTYNPAGWDGNLNGARHISSLDWFGVFNLHDSEKYPHNREGFRLNARYNFAQDAGAVWAKAAFLKQKRTSLYDVRVTPNALGAGTPNFPVIGFSPGFVDPVFFGYAHPNLYGPNSANSFTANLAPLEDPRGSQDEFNIGASYRFKDPGVKVTTNYSRYRQNRASGLAAALGGSQNQVDLTSDSFRFGVGWDINDKVTLNGGFDFVAVKGHYDPAGLYNDYANRTGQTNFTNVNSEQTIPHLGVDWKVAENTEFNLTVRYFNTEDQVDPRISTGNPNLGQIGSTTHPFDWGGLQVGTHFKLSF